MQQFTQLDELERDDVPAAADGSGSGLSRADLFSGRRAAVRRSPDARYLPCMARGRRQAEESRRDRAAVRRRPRAGAPRRQAARVCGAAADAQRRSRRGDARLDRAQLRIDGKTIRAAQWVANGPGWVAVMLGSRDELLALKPDMANLEPQDIGVVAPMPKGNEALFEMRAFVGGGGPFEDPVTGSLQAGLAMWLMSSGRAPERYVAIQGTALGRDGRVYVEKRGEDIWVGGDCVTLVEGKVEL